MIFSRNKHGAPPECWNVAQLSAQDHAEVVVHLESSRLRKPIRTLGNYALQFFRRPETADERYLTLMAPDTYTASIPTTQRVSGLIQVFAETHADPPVSRLPNSEDTDAGGPMLPTPAALFADTGFQGMGVDLHPHRHLLLGKVTPALRFITMRRGAPSEGAPETIELFPGYVDLRDGQGFATQFTHAPQARPHGPVVVSLDNYQPKGPAGAAPA